MPKEKQDDEQPTTTKEFFFPPQDGHNAFVCEAINQQQAEAQYTASIEK